jgi:hypothetical protein
VRGNREDWRGWRRKHTGGKEGGGGGGRGRRGAAFSCPRLDFFGLGEETGVIWNILFSLVRRWVAATLMIRMDAQSDG